MKNFKEDSLEDYSNELSDVYHFAKAKHDATGAIRKNSGLPYFVHPEMVAEVVAAYGGTDAQIEAALLHDTVEDTDVSVEELERLYGPEVAQIVAEVTNYKPDVEYYGKENYINHELMELSDEALLIKVADCVCNYLDNPKPGQAERLVRNLSYLIENRAELPDGVRRLLKSIPVLNDIFDLDKEEFEEPYIDDLEGYQRIVASKKMPKNKIKEMARVDTFDLSPYDLRNQIKNYVRGRLQDLIGPEGAKHFQINQPKWDMVYNGARGGTCFAIRTQGEDYYMSTFLNSSLNWQGKGFEEFKEDFEDMINTAFSKTPIREEVSRDAQHCFRVFNMHPDVAEKLESLAKEEPDWLIQFTPQDKNYFLLTNSEVKSKDQLRKLIDVEASYQMQLLF